MRSFLTTFAATLVMVTFVMLLTILFQVSDMIARGVAWQPIAKILISGIPTVLTFSIPISCITTSLLVFERLSAEGEITAMRACGVSIWQIAARPILFSVLMSSLCLYFNTELAARAHYIRRQQTSELGIEAPLTLLEAGRFIKVFAGLTVYVGSKDGDEVRDIVIYDARSGEEEREIRAKRGTLSMSEDDRHILIKLYDSVRIDPFQSGGTSAGFMNSLTIKVDAGTVTRKRYKKKTKDMSVGEIIEGVLEIDSNAGEVVSRGEAARRMSLVVEANQRIVLSLSCLAFVLLGIPFGIKTPRSTSSLGIALSLGIVFSFYLFVILVRSLAARPEFRPDLIVWTPVFLSVVVGISLLRRMR
jgi:lipopolysaccharide export system permease protein